MLYYNNYIEFKAGNGEAIRIGFNMFGTVFKSSDGSLRKPGSVIIDYKGEMKMATTGTIYKFQYDDTDDEYKCKIFISHLNGSVPRVYLVADVETDKLVVHSCTIDLGDTIFTTNNQLIEESDENDDPDAPAIYEINYHKCLMPTSSITHKDIYNMRIEKNH